MLWVLQKFIIPAFFTLILSYLLTPATAILAKTTGAMDIPDMNRKINERPMPRLGGLGFYCAFFISALIFADMTNGTVLALLAGGGILVAGGVTDDTLQLSPVAKLLIQLAAAVVAIVFIEIPKEFSLFGLLRFSLPYNLGILFAIGRMVFTVNAVNFSDGLDGLASGLSIVALISLSIFGLKNGNSSVAVASAILASAVLGFVPYNKYHARIFMGDSGSQFLGYAIALVALGASKRASFTAETVLFLIVPIADTWFSVVRRIMQGKSPFRADKGHLHHFLLSCGLSHPRAVKLLVSVSALAALLTLFYI